MAHGSSTDSLNAVGTGTVGREDTGRGFLLDLAPHSTLEAIMCFRPTSVASYQSEVPILVSFFSFHRESQPNQVNNFPFHNVRLSATVSNDGP